MYLKWRQGFPSFHFHSLIPAVDLTTVLRRQRCNFLTQLQSFYGICQWSVDLQVINNHTSLAFPSPSNYKRATGNDTLESFLSKIAVGKWMSTVTFERNLALFFFWNKLSRLQHVLFLQVFFRKSLSTATFERKLSSVSLPKLTKPDWAILHYLCHRLVARIMFSLGSVCLLAE